MSHMLTKPLMVLEEKESAELRQCVTELDDTRAGLCRSIREREKHSRPFFLQYKSGAFQTDSSSIPIKRWERIGIAYICSRLSREKAQRTSRVTSKRTN